MSDPTVIKSRLTSASSVPGRISRPSRPESMSQLPGTFFTSPGFILGIVIVELVYGFVLFLALSGSRKAPPRAIISSDDELALLSAAKERPSPPPRAAVEAPKEEETDKDQEKEANRPPPIKEEATKSGKSKSRKPKGTDTQTKTEAPKISEPLATSPDSSRSKPEYRSQQFRTGIGRAALPYYRRFRGSSIAGGGTEMTQKPEMPVPPAHQVAMNIRPEPPKLKLEEPRVGPIGPLIDPDRDCKVSSDEKGFTIETPGKPHIITPEQANAPRALEKVTGDFVAEVHVPGEIRPGVNPLEQFPFTFQGAGLLLWLDQENYIRLERTVRYEAGSRHQVMVESFKGGKPGRTVKINVKGDKITLRMERHGGEINCSYSSDGKTWLPVRRWAAGLPPTVLVGVSASNISPKPFEARFTDFSLKHAGK